jgi:hypothetical protein
MSRHPVRRSVSDVDAVTASATYRELIERLNLRIRESQARAARAVGSEDGTASDIDLLIVRLGSTGEDDPRPRQADRPAAQGRTERAGSRRPAREIE